MSLWKKGTSRPRLYSAGGFGSLSTGSNSIPKSSTNNHVTPVTFNESLLDPLNTNIDPAIQARRTQEKEEIKDLNNRFASYIENVRLLEQQNKLLETKWSLLQGDTFNPSEVEPLYMDYIVLLRGQLDQLTNDKIKFEKESQAVHRQLDDFATRYKNEVNKRQDAENEFVQCKKDVDHGFLSKVNLESLLSSLKDDFDFLKEVYKEELNELKNSLRSTSVVVEMDNSRELNMDQVVSDVKAHYKDIADRSRAETEVWYKTKFDQMTIEANQYDDELRASKEEVADLNRQINRLEREIQNATAKNESLKNDLPQMEADGDKAMLDATAHIKELEDALKHAKQCMIRQIKEYQELLNVKIALDIEITTYKKMLEEEENRCGFNTVLSIQEVPVRRKPVQEKASPQPQVKTLQRQKSNPLVIKKVETMDRFFYS